MLFYLKDKQSSNISLIFISFTQAHALSACSTHGHCPNMPTNTYHPRMHAAEGVSVAVNNAVGSFVAEQSGVTNSIVGAVVGGASVVGRTVSTTGTIPHRHWVSVQFQNKGSGSCPTAQCRHPKWYCPRQHDGCIRRISFVG